MPVKFERYFIADKSLHKETKGYYYALRNKEEICDRILEEFGVTGQHTHIINGHVPVKTIKGEQPMKAGGKIAGHRRWLFESLSAGDRYCRIYAGISFPRLAVGAA